MPRACFGREGLIEEVVELAKDMKPIALIGPGGIGKTSIALTVLHDDRIKERFGDNRRFICCNQFPGSPTHFLACLSKVIGARIENPKNLAPLRPFLSSKDMLIVLDGAEAILDPQGMNGREIYTIVDKLCQIKTICLCITSRIIVLPLDCTCLKVPTLSMEAAYETFYSTYGGSGRSVIIEDLLHCLDFHPLSIMLVATTASNNSWGHVQLTKQWDKHCTKILQMDSAAAIEFLLTSPTFCELGTSARDLLGVVAFFPQGVDERNLEKFFPLISNRKSVFDKFCVLSLVYRSNGYITMLAPIRDHLHPKDPKSFPLLYAIKDCYFTWLSVDPSHSQDEFGGTQWIKSEHINVEHLLDIFTSIDPGSLDVWDACDHFMHYLYWHKPRQTVLKSKIKSLPDQHPSKPQCLFRLSWLCGLSEDYREQEQLLTYTLTLKRGQGDDPSVALTLRSLSYVNRMLGLYQKGIPQAEEALEIYKQSGNTMEQAECLHNLALLLLHDNQLNAAEDSILCAINFLQEKGHEYLLSRSYRILGEIYNSKGEKEKAIENFHMALRIASNFCWQDELFWIHYTLALLSSTRGEFTNANTHITQAKSHTADNTYKQGRAMNAQAWVWYHEHRLEDAKSEALGALRIYAMPTSEDSDSDSGSSVDITVESPSDSDADENISFGRKRNWDRNVCNNLLSMIEQAMESQSTSNSSGEVSVMTCSLSLLTLSCLRTQYTITCLQEKLSRCWY